MVKKRILALCLVFAALFCLAGCGNKKPAAPKIHQKVKATNITKKWLTAGNYIIGYNLPEGIYIISNGNNSGDVTLYRRDCPDETFHIDSKHSYARTFQNGDAITVHGNANVLLSCDQSSNAFAKSQVNDANKSGNIDTDDYSNSSNMSEVSVSENCTIGDTNPDTSDHIPQVGWYNIKVTGKGHIKIDGEGGKTIDEDMSDDGTGGPASYKSVYLKKGQKIEVVNYNPKDPETGSQDETSFSFMPLNAKASNYQASDSYNTKQQTKNNQLLDGNALSDE